MLRKLLATVLTSVLLVGTGAVVASASAYTPDSGSLFNNPRGSAEAKNRLAVKLRKTIWSVPRGGVIRIAVYSFDRKDLGDALVAACDRKVSVQIVINDNWISGQVKRMQRKLGTNIDPHYNDACHKRERPADPTDPTARPPHPEPSFIKICHRACRSGGPGNQHAKIYMFSKAGSAENVIMVGSNNMTHYAASTHWNDMFTVSGRAQMFADYSTIFRELAEEKTLAQPYRIFVHGNLTSEFGPLQNVPRSQDPVARRIGGVSCRAVGGTGTNGHTVVRIAMYAWVGDRGRYLARKVADLDRSGCIVKALLSQPSRDVKRILRNGGVAMRSADLNLDEDPETGFGETPWEHFTHEKWMSVNGTWNGTPQRIVWTGSENWSDKSLYNDEVTLGVVGNGAHRGYARHFETMWGSSRYTRPL